METQRAKDHLARHDSLRSSRSVWDSWWQELNEVLQPRKANITYKQNSPGDGRQAQLYTNTGIHAHRVMVAGLMAYVTPKSKRWIDLLPPPHLKENNRAKKWYSVCGQILFEEIQKSNFYSSIFEIYADLAGIGTANLYVEKGKRTALNFKTIEAGTFCIQENEEGYIDTVYREFDLTARQAKQKFGEDALPKKIQECLKDTKQQDKSFRFIHAVYPRDESKQAPDKALDPKSFPFESLYICREGNTEIEEGGYHNNPYIVSRYEKVNYSPWGWCPGEEAIPEINRAQHINKMADALAEIAAFPRLLIPSDLEGEVDFRPAGVTMYDPQSPSKPEEWGTQGRYDITQDRLQSTEDKINEAFHVDLFKMISMRDKQMTATEVAELQSEKFSAYSSVNDRMSTELFLPAMQRCFNLLHEQEKFPKPPPEVLEQDNFGSFIPMPNVELTGHMAVAMKQMENANILRSFEGILPILQLDPSASDVMDIQELLKIFLRNSGAPEQVIRDDEHIKAMVEQRAQQQQAMAQMEMAQAGAGAAKDLKQAEIL